jgi:hypothetical protein
MILTLEDGTDMLSRNVGKELPPYAAEYPRREHTSSKHMWTYEVQSKAHATLIVLLCIGRLFGFQMKTSLWTCESVDLWVTLLEQLSVQLVMLLQRKRHADVV